MRVGELVNLDIADMDFEERECVVLGKGDKERIVYFDAKTKLHLEKYLLSRNDENPALFVTIRNPHRRLKAGGVEIMLKKIAKEAGITAHPHTLRHSFATHLIEDETKPEYVQAMLGHRSPHSTTIYVHVSNKSLMGVKSPLDKPKAKKSRPRKSGGRKDG